MGFRGRERDETRRHCHSFFQKNGSHLDTGSGIGERGTAPIRHVNEQLLARKGPTPRCAVILSRQLCRSAAVWDKLACTLSARLFRAQAHLEFAAETCLACQPARELGSKPSALQGLWGWNGSVLQPDPTAPNSPASTRIDDNLDTTQPCQRQPMSRAFAISNHTEAESQASESEPPCANPPCATTSSGSWSG
jgi:hypothetical protein